MPETRQLICEGWVDPEHYTGAQEFHHLRSLRDLCAAGKEGMFLQRQTHRTA